MDNKKNLNVCDKNIFSEFIKIFVNEKPYFEFAKNNKRTRIYASDFLINPHRESFKNIFEEVNNKDVDVFNIIICLSTIYDNGFNDYLDYEHLSKKELIQLLKNQEKDMEGEALLYVNDVELTKYWDIMIFDDTYLWTYVLTHEDDVDGTRMCFVQNRLETN